MIQQLIHPNLNISKRLRIVKTILSISILASIGFTYSWWLPTSSYPKLALYDIAFNDATDYVLLGFLSISLLGMFLYRSPKFFVFISTLCLLFAVLTDTAKGQYWLFFYVAVLLLLCGHNWRIDNPRRYSAVFTAIKLLICVVYILSAVQFLKTSFNGNTWLQFIAPLERFCTPEQHGYLLGMRYVIPILEILVAVSLFVDRIKMAAIVLATLMHLFSFSLLLMEASITSAPVLIWHICMIFLLYFLFAGKTGEQKIYAISFNLYGTLILLIVVFGGFIKQDLFPENNIDLMQSNNSQQIIYVKQTEKSKLPLYIQYFISDKLNDDYSALSVSNWCANATKTKCVLSKKQLLQVCHTLKNHCGTKADIVLSVTPKKNKEIAENRYH